MYDNETEILSSCHLSLSTYFRIVINPVFLYTKKKITKLGSLRYRLKKKETKKQQECTLGSHCENEWQSSRKPISTNWRNTRIKCCYDNWTLTI